MATLNIKEHASTANNRTLIQSSDITISIAISFNTASELFIKNAAKGKYLPLSLEKTAVEAARELYVACKNGYAPAIYLSGNTIHTLMLNDINQDNINQWVYDMLSLVKYHLPPEKSIRRIFSGGQSGVEIAGASAAQALDIETVIIMPKGYIQRNPRNRDERHSLEYITTQVNSFKSKILANSNQK